MRITRLALPLLALVVAGCGGGRDVTADSVAAARKLWKDANIRNYDLEWTTSGAQEGHYLVYVRDGAVRAIRQVVRNPRDGVVRTIDARPGNMSYYGIDGLFKIIEEERMQLREDRPFGQPKGTAVVLKFVPDAKLGYPSQYRRDVAGTSRGLAIDVVKFVADPATPLPPPST